MPRRGHRSAGQCTSLAKSVVARDRKLGVNIMETNLITWSSELASTLLTPLEKRWKHVQGVAQMAYQVVEILPEEERPYLIAAAYLHDIGYAPALRKTGFHPLDGANYLRDQKQERLARLVAYHSGAQFEADLRGLAPQLALFQPEISLTRDALDYCDMATSPTGERITFEERISDILARYGEMDIVGQAISQARPSLWRAVERVQQRLASNQLDG